VWASDLVRRFWRRRHTLVLFVAIVVVLPRLSTAALTNAGSLAVAQAALLSGRNESREPYARLLERARAQFERAVALDGDLAAGRWGLGRAALALVELGVREERNGIAAADALSPLVVDGTDNPLLYQDALVAFSYSGQPEDTIALYETHLPLRRVPSISDTVALAYLQRGAPGDLACARTLRPGDLYVNHYLWQAARDAGDAGAAAVYSDTLVYFPLESVDPTDERLLDYAGEVIPSLLEEGLWDRSKTLDVVSFLVWQHNGAAGVERLLQQLGERHPADPDWLFFLAELYHRRGDLDQAEAVYRQVQALDLAYAQAYLRLGIVAEAQSQIPDLSSQTPSSRPQGQLKDAARWYGQYYALASDDLLGLKRLAEVCMVLEQVGMEDESCRQAAFWVGSFEFQVGGESKTLKLGTSPAAILLGALEARTDDRRIVAELLGVPMESIELGPNLVKIGGFEQGLKGDESGVWRWEFFPGGRSSDALFAGAIDGLAVFSHKNALRVSGLWETKGSRGRAGYWGGSVEQKLFPGELGYLSFYYRTTPRYDHTGNVLLRSQHGSGFLQHRLPMTRGAWRKFATVFGNTTPDPIDLRDFLLLRTFDVGSVYFDDVLLQRISPLYDLTEVRGLDWSETVVIR
jgi:tetratricopeptide (TPR) repeat protein